MKKIVHLILSALLVGQLISTSAFAQSANDLRISQRNPANTAWVDHLFAPVSGGTITDAASVRTALGAGASSGGSFVNTTLSGNTTVTGNITVSANATFSGNTTLGNLTLTGLTYGSLGVNGSGVLKLNKTVYASSVATLDSNVLTGGGTDVTSALQAVLNLASSGTVQLELVMDGPALVTGLRIYGNTTIRCLTQSCGFYLKAQSNVSVLRNATPSATVVTDKHIRLIGGTYNGNSANQTAGSSPDASGDVNLHAIAFYGVDDVRVTGVSTYYGNFMAYMFSLWSNVWIENCENVNYTDAANDAFHFVGSGSYLTVKNVSGSCGADFIPLNSSDYKDSPTGSSWVVRDGLIQHVLIDGVFLKNTRNGVGIVSGASGAGCDDIVVRNVQGTCQAYAVSLWNPWSTSYDGGYIGTVLLDGITATNNIPNAEVIAIFSETNGTGPTPGLNRIRNLRITNVQWDVSNTHTWLYIDGRARINALEVSGVAINEAVEVSADMSFMVSTGQIDRLTVNNLNWLRPAAATVNKTVIQNGVGGIITQLNVNGVNTNRVNRTIGNDGTITAQNDWVDNGVITAGQLVSTNTSGQPITVLSNTTVTNFSASFLNGATFASPGTIGGTTPGGATFTSITTGNATVTNNLTASATTNSTASNVGTLIVGNGTVGVTTSIGGGNITSGGTTFNLGFNNQSGVNLTLGQTGSASGDSKTLNFATGGYGAPGTFGNTSTGEKIKFYRNGADTDVAMGVSATEGLWIKSQGNGSAAAIGIYATATNSGAAPLVWSMTKAGNITQTGSLTLSQTAGLIGTTTNNSANAGSVGEFVSSAIASGSAVSLTTATGANVTSISLTAGDWDVDGNVNFSAASATVTGTSAGITSTSATVPTDGTEAFSGVQVTLASETDTVTLPRKRFSLSGTTTVYLVGKSTFSAGTVTAFGSITARRVR